MVPLKREGGENALRALRWTARIWSSASIVIIILFFIGERFDPSTLGRHEWPGFVFFPAGVCIGMILSWRSEAAGGIAAVASLVAFYMVHYAASGRFPEGWAWLAFSAPGFLFLSCWVLSPGARGRW